MINAIIKGLLSILSTLVKLITFIPNQIITAALPDISSFVVTTSNNIVNLFDGITWGLGFVPSAVLSALLFIFSVEIAKHSIWVLTNVFYRIWEVLQRVKFW